MLFSWTQALVVFLVGFVASMVLPLVCRLLMVAGARHDFDAALAAGEPVTHEAVLERWPRARVALGRWRPEGYVGSRLHGKPEMTARWLASGAPAGLLVRAYQAGVSDAEILAHLDGTARLRLGELNFLAELSGRVPDGVRLPGEH